MLGEDEFPEVMTLQEITIAYHLEAIRLEN